MSCETKRHAPTIGACRCLKPERFASRRRGLPLRCPKTFQRMTENGVLLPERFAWPRLVQVCPFGAGRILCRSLPRVPYSIAFLHSKDVRGKCQASIGFWRLLDRDNLVDKGGIATVVLPPTLGLVLGIVGSNA